MPTSTQAGVFWRALNQSSILGRLEKVGPARLISEFHPFSVRVEFMSIGFRISEQRFERRTRWIDEIQGRSCFGRRALFHDGIGVEYIDPFVGFRWASKGDIGIGGRFGDCSPDVRRVMDGSSIAPDGKLHVSIFGHGVSS